jgi:hypothetical protein
LVQVGVLVQSQSEIRSQQVGDAIALGAVSPAAPAGAFRSNWFLVQFIVGISVVLLIVQAMSAYWWYAEIVLIKRELAGGRITVAEAARVDFWNDLLMKLTIGFAVINFLSFIVWLVRAARNARALTGKPIHVTVGGFLVFQLWIHKILSDLWLAGSSAPESPQTKPRLPRLMIVWCVLIFVCGLWKAPMSTGRTLSKAIETPAGFRPEDARRWRHDFVGWLLPDCKTLFVASLVHMFSYGPHGSRHRLDRSDAYPEMGRNDRCS